jgi:hypothetical protein
VGVAVVVVDALGGTVVVVASADAVEVVAVDVETGNVEVGIEVVVDGNEIAVGNEVGAVVDESVAAVDAERRTVRFVHSAVAEGTGSPASAP